MSVVRLNRTDRYRLRHRVFGLCDVLFVRVCFANPFDFQYHRVQFVVARIEMRRDANACARTIVHQELTILEDFGNFVTVRDVHGDDAAACVRFAVGGDRES